MIAGVALALVLSARRTVKRFPTYTHFLGVSMGRSTTFDLEAQIGKGKVQVGGHSDSGRLFKFRDCKFATDAFTRHGNRMLFDMIILFRWKGKINSCYPFSKFKTWELGNLRYDEPMAQCVKELKKAGLEMKPDPPYGVTRKDFRIIYFEGNKYLRRYTLELSGGTNLKQVSLVMDEDIVEPK